MAAGVHGNGGLVAESSFRLERTGFAGRSPGALDRQEAMDPQDYPVRHFESMARLAAELRTLPA